MITRLSGHIVAHDSMDVLVVFMFQPIISLTLPEPHQGLAVFESIGNGLCTFITYFISPKPKKQREDSNCQPDILLQHCDRHKNNFVILREIVCFLPQEL